jgi:MoaA/NifB/PqqE/SkfB family radical SAM enzyme
MKAKISPRINSERTKLETVVPLNSPFVLFVDPSDACNFKCNFCPTSDRSLMKTVGRPWKQMAMDLYDKIIMDIDEFDKPIKVLRLYKDGEPLLNKNLGQMIRKAKTSKNIMTVDTTTNASLLTEERGIELVDAGLDAINISVYGVNDSQYQTFSSTKTKFSQILSNVRDFYKNKKSCEMLVKVNGDSLNDFEKQVFLDEFGDFADKVYIEHTMSCWPEFEQTVSKVNQEVGIYGQSITGINVCPYPFYGMAINSDGLVSLCFLDWARKLVLGDVNRQSIRDIWSGKELRGYQKMFLEGRRNTHPVCGGCGQMTHGNPDNIDEHADKLLTTLLEAGYFNEAVEPKYMNKVINIKSTQ